MQDVDKTIRWVWMMDWCKTNRLAPANATVWKMAEEAYQKCLRYN